VSRAWRVTHDKDGGIERGGAGSGMMCAMVKCGLIWRVFFFQFGACHRQEFEVLYHILVSVPFLTIL
jgi:hypothetical protein